MDLDELLQRQADVLSTAQSLEFMTRGALRARLVGGRWQRPHRGVVVAHNGPLDQRQREWVALLTAPPGSALAGATAAALEGLAGFETPVIHVVIPQGARRVELPGTRCSWSTRLDDRDVHPRRAPRRTRLARSVLDMASVADRERWVRTLVIAPVQQRLLRPDDLLDALSRRGHCRHHALILESVEDARGGIHSVPERDFDALRARSGLPAPSRQQRLLGRDGRYYLDADWETLRLSVEVHGAHHRDAAQWEADLARHNDATALGRRVLHLSSYAVRREPERVIALLRRAAAASAA